jgi:hypothetical protein
MCHGAKPAVPAICETAVGAVALPRDARVSTLARPEQQAVAGNEIAARAAGPHRQMMAGSDRGLAPQPASGATRAPTFPIKSNLRARPEVGQIGFAYGPLTSSSVGRNASRSPSMP